MQNRQTFLPAPIHKYEPVKEVQQEKQAKKTTVVIPPYLKRQRFIPRTLEDFGDGGAFPEIHIAQYPLNMGRVNGSSTGSVITTVVKSTGEVDAAEGILTQGRKKNQILYSKLTDMLEKTDESSLERPSEEAIMANQQKTKDVIERLIKKKTGFNNPSQVITNEEPRTEFIKYTPVDGKTGEKKTQRIIRIVEEQIDPLNPPIHKLKKLPPGQGSPPVAVMHSPQRKLTVKDQEDWKIPPCISNWKNAGGKVLPLDKRLAADGQDLRETQINDRFAEMNTALTKFMEAARETNEQKYKIRAAEKEKENKRKLMELRQKQEQFAAENRQISDRRRQEDETEEQAEDRRERDRQRREMDARRKREYNLKHAGRLAYAEGTHVRDVSDRVALGELSQLGGQYVQYDSRLFNQTSGVTSGFGNEEDYNIYDKPLFNDKNSAYTFKVDRSALETDNTFAELKGIGDRLKSKEEDKVYKRVGPLAFDDSDDEEKRSKRRKNSDEE